MSKCEMTKSSVVFENKNNLRTEKWRAMLHAGLRRVYRIVMKPYWWWMQSWYPVCEVKQACDSFLSIPIVSTITIPHPGVIAKTSYTRKFQSLKASLPDAYVAVLHNVTLIESSDIVITQDGTALYDEVAHDPDGKYGLRNNQSKLIVSRKCYPLSIGLRYKVDQVRKLPTTVVHFCKDHSYNYFHWLLEALPRLWLIEQRSEWNQLPLIVDSLLPQQEEALHLLINGKREIISLERGEACEVSELIYPSGLSHAHDNYDHLPAYDYDFVISPVAIQYLRERFLPLAINKERVLKKLYISRKHLGAKKRLLNDEEIASYLSARGYEIIYPELLSFVEQVTIFSQAEVIVSASGAALANMVFAPKGCKVYVLSANNAKVNIAMFSSLGAAIDCRIHYVLGQDTVKNNFSAQHNSFFIELGLLQSL